MVTNANNFHQDKGILQCQHFASQNPTILVIPDRNTETTASFVDLAFNSISHYQDYKRVFLISDITMPPSSECANPAKPTIYLPEPSNEVYSECQRGTLPFEASDLEEVQLSTSSFVNFAKIFAAPLNKLKNVTELTSKPFYLLATSNIKASHLCDFIRIMLPSRNDLFIFQATLSAGNSEVETKVSDISIITALLAQNPDVKKSTTRCAPLFKTIARMGYAMHLRPNVLAYAPIRINPQIQTRFRGVCSMAYFF
ncbi:MAG: hypothetical protein U0L03_08515 [Succinivibrionaceae bacterium]|nr:hypothetical protein [Succinivibrionaceae bacterium]